MSDADLDETNDPDVFETLKLIAMGILLGCGTTSGTALIMATQLGYPIDVAMAGGVAAGSAMALFFPAGVYTVACWRWMRRNRGETA